MGKVPESKSQKAFLKMRENNSPRAVIQGVLTTHDEKKKKNGDGRRQERKKSMKTHDLTTNI